MGCDSFTRPRVHRVTSDKCECGLTTLSTEGQVVHAKKPTTWMTYSVHSANRLNTRCFKTHTHQPLVAGRASEAALYLGQRITELVRGTRDTADAAFKDNDDAPDQTLSNAMACASLFHDHKSISANVREADLINTNKNRTTTFRFADGSSKVASLEENFKSCYYDEYTRGHYLSRISRVLCWTNSTILMTSSGLGVPLQQALTDKEGKVIGTRWVLCNKQDASDPDVRARLVAQEINTHPDDSFYAATTPLEAKRLLFICLVSGERAVENGFQIKASFFYRCNECIF